MITWKDVTSYSRGERDKIEPRTWETRVGHLRIVVTRRHQMEGWYLSCMNLNVESFFMPAATADEAKNLAPELLRDLLVRHLAALDHALGKADPE